MQFCQDAPDSRPSGVSSLVFCDRPFPFEAEIQKKLANDYRLIQSRQRCQVN
ncbi:MAG: hypothetical protein HC936_01780 [Leptolyngbyaceae cyanobacterium SU_3_3]|nr:hypothetical protein [Leptolyngbyaceae cyanobacterium SU_3_3]NJR51358.1 hypothetical protein [Leptolyngbyaceae cyanobacterium CSU_1_3]